MPCQIYISLAWTLINRVKFLRGVSALIAGNLFAKSASAQSKYTQQTICHGDITHWICGSSVCDNTLSVGGPVCSGTMCTPELLKNTGADACRDEVISTENPSEVLSLPVVPPKCSPNGSGTPVANMHISDNVMPKLKEYEGYNMISKFVDHVTRDKYGLYNDIAGQCTQGIGDKVHDGKCTLQDIDNYNNEYPNGGMTEAQAEQLLRTDIQAKERQVSNALGRNVELTQNQFDALILLSFNVGAQGALGKDKSLGEHIRAGKCDHTTIAHDFNQFNKVKLIDPITKEPIRDPITGKYVLVEDNGLSLRRASEAAMFNFGVY